MVAENWTPLSIPLNLLVLNGMAQQFLSIYTIPYEMLQEE